LRPSPVNILYVEDDEVDVQFAEHALGANGQCPNVKLSIVTDGEEAAAYLGITDNGRPRPARPNVILLDLNLPKITGKELLRRIKGAEHLNGVPVVIFSTSNHQTDIDETFSLGASGYFTKPSSLATYRKIFQVISDYWAGYSELPTSLPL
jgi:CheY-like chemotaxis protein